MRSPIIRPLLSSVGAVALSACLSTSVQAADNSTCVVVMGGCSAPVQRDGTFVIHNVPLGSDAMAVLTDGIFVIDEYVVDYVPAHLKVMLSAPDNQAYTDPIYLVQPMTQAPTKWYPGGSRYSPTNVTVHAGPPQPASSQGSARPAAVPQSVTAMAPDGTLPYGSTVQLSVSAVYRDDAPADVATNIPYYASSNTSIAAVTTSGAITAGFVSQTRPATVTVNVGGTSVRYHVQVPSPGLIDSDGDGMPDAWEILYGLNPHDPSDAALDPDHDGLTNLQEYQAGTNPLDPDTDHDGLLDGVDPQPLIPERESPVVTITQPAPAAPLQIGQNVTVHVHATDNAAVRRIFLFVDGIQVGTNASADLDVTVVIPAEPTLTLTARAQDFAGNIGETSQAYTISSSQQGVVVGGRILAPNGKPQPGVAVKMVDGDTVLTGNDGTFSFQISGAVPAQVEFVALGSIASRTHAVYAAVPIHAAIASTGDLTLAPTGFMSDLGVRTTIDLNQSTAHALGFPFVFFGQTYTSLFLNGHGSITFGQPDSTPFAFGVQPSATVSQAIAGFLTGPPRIAPCFSFINVSSNLYVESYGNLLSSPNSDTQVGLYVNDLPDRVVFTWFGVHHSLDITGELNSFQATLFASGDIRLAYSTPVASSAVYQTRTLVGVSPGGAVVTPAVAADFTQTVSTAQACAIYQYFPSVIPDFTLGQRSIDFHPGSGGGYTVVGQAFQQLPSGETVIAGRFFNQGVPVSGARVSLSSGESFTTDAQGVYAGRVQRRPLFVASGVSGGTRDGSSWANAFSGLQDAMDASRAGDEIWVASGTYYPSRIISGSDPRSKTFSYYPKPAVQVTIYGGFIGTETSRTQRDWRAHPTILSGELGSPTNPDDNAGTVFTLEGETLDGLTIENGGYAGLSTYAGGVLRHCLIRNNGFDSTAGQGLLVNYNTVFLSDCVIANNAGPGISSSGGIQMDDCVISGNQSSQHGGGYFQAASLGGGAVSSMTNCTVSGNTGTVGGVELGPDMYFLGSPYHSALTMTNCVVWGNTATATPAYAISAGIITTYSCVEGGVLGTGNIASNPLFLNPNNLQGPDGLWGTADDGLAIGPASQCIDAGLLAAAPDQDITGGLRAGAGLGADIGAYERSAIHATEPLATFPALERARRVTVTVTGNGLNRTFANAGIFIDLVNELGDPTTLPLAPSATGWNRKGPAPVAFQSGKGDHR